MWRTNTEMILKVAGLVLQLDPHNNDMLLPAPESHKPFLVDDPVIKKLTLSVRQGALSSTKGWRRRYYDERSWRIWEDGVGRYIFIAPKEWPPARQLTVDSAFSMGEVLGEFDLNLPLDKAIYPLEGMDVVLFVNWLASLGDILLHASGIAYQGEGYVFSGSSGSGKSTLATELTTVPGVKVLGEDQVIVRWQNNRFMVYGTPWHTNPARCAPDGVPLKKLFFLNRKGTHAVESCGGKSGIEKVLQNAFIPYYNRSGVEHILETLPHFAGEVPFFTMGFQIGADVMALVKNA